MNVPHEHDAEGNCVFGSCFYCGREAAGIMAGLPDTLAEFNHAAVCGDCYGFVLDVMADIRFVDDLYIWLEGQDET